jgi:hypothetical protein
MKTHPEKRWRITYTNNLGRSFGKRFTYGQISFESEEAANAELKRILKAHNPERSSNEDYKVDSYIGQILDTPIYPFNDSEENDID